MQREITFSNDRDSLPASVDTLQFLSITATRFQILKRITRVLIIYVNILAGQNTRAGCFFESILSSFSAFLRFEGITR